MTTSTIKKDVIIKSGYGTVTVSPNTSASIDITFSHPYPQGTSYAVTISQSGSGNGTYIYADIICGTINRTNTGFTAVVSSIRTTEVTVNFMWSAVPILN